MKLNWVKWRLMLTTLPITFTIVILKHVIVEYLYYDGLVKFSEIGLVITGGVFLIGFMLAGVMGDYKESEKIPGELACAIETIDDIMILAHGAKGGGFDLDQARTQLFDITESILKWFRREETDEAVFNQINDLTEVALAMEKAGVGAIASKLTSEQHNLRRLFSRVNVIKKTRFLSTGYAFLEVMTIVIICLLLFSKFDNYIVSIIIVSFVTQIFVYMVRLIHDIDEPFEYSSKGVVRASDIDLYPIVELSLRSKKRLSEWDND